MPKVKVSDKRVVKASSPVPEQAAAPGERADYLDDLKRLQAGGRLVLGTALQPGEYVLQVVVTDALAKEKYRTATQWIDFEIVK